jgi:N-acetylglucosaminyldiphosphoundecaprenol N-acetyl-beta-D-mannosaminyltransferase
VFIYGAREEVSDKAVRELQLRYPALQIVGRANGYVSSDDMPALIERINESGAQVLFLALGSPRQENWFVKHAGQLRTVRVCQGIGGTLDTIAGNVKRAPRFWCRMNLEWFYRLMAEPKRLTRQWVLPIFAFKVFRRKCSMIFS